MTEEEIARLRGYLVAQSMRRTPAQIIEALQETYHQFTSAVAGLSNAAYYARFDDHAWSAYEIVEHVCLFMSVYQIAICGVLETDQRPPNVENRQEIIPRAEKIEARERALSTLEEIMKRLTHAVLHADPSLHLDLTWKHFELGAMHWREWLLFARAHLLDHVRQMQQLQVPAE
jgi:hypothetical protein